jgi:hypothetical protein
VRSAVRYPRDYVGWGIVSALDTGVVGRLRSAEFAEAQQGLAELDDRLEATAESVSELLYRLVPLVDDKASRQRVIRCRRRLYGWTPLAGDDLALVRDLLLSYGSPDEEATLTRFHERVTERQAYAAKLEQSIRQCTGTTRRLLRACLEQDDHPVNLGVAFSAPDLWKALGGIEWPGGDDPLNRQELAYLSYLVRVATKCTAYSTFSELRMLVRDSAPDERIPRNGKPRRLVELNPTLPELVLETVLRGDAAAMNGALIVSAYLRDRQAQPGSLVWTQATEAVGLGRSVHRNKVNLLSGDGPRAETLTAERAGAGLGQLVDLGLVVRGPRSFGTEAALAALRAAGGSDESAVYAELLSDRDRLGAAPANERAELSTRLRTAGDKLIGLLGGRSARGTVDPQSCRHAPAGLPGLRRTASGVCPVRAARAGNGRPGDRRDVRLVRVGRRRRAVAGAACTVRGRGQHRCLECRPAARTSVGSVGRRPEGTRSGAWCVALSPAGRPGGRSGSGWLEVVRRGRGAA